MGFPFATHDRLHHALYQGVTGFASLFIQLNNGEIETTCANQPILTLELLLGCNFLESRFILLPLFLILYIEGLSQEKGGAKNIEVLSCCQSDQTLGKEIGKVMHQSYPSCNPFLLLIQDAIGFPHLIVLMLSYFMMQYYLEYLHILCYQICNYFLS